MLRSSVFGLSDGPHMNEPISALWKHPLRQQQALFDAIATQILKMRVCFRKVRGSLAHQLCLGDCSLGDYRLSINRSQPAAGDRATRVSSPVNKPRALSNTSRVSMCADVRSKSHRCFPSRCYCYHL